MTVSSMHLVWSIVVYIQIITDATFRHFDHWVERGIELFGKDSTLRGDISGIKIICCPSADHHMILVSHTRKALPYQTFKTHLLTIHILGAYETNSINIIDVSSFIERHRSSILSGHGDYPL